jgi:1-phosphatidylinositol-4-phosphate 5-kinase
MLKTISRTEFIHFRTILKAYYLHLDKYPHSLVTRFFGLHKMKAINGVRIYFVIMANVFSKSLGIDIRFDLKGSTSGRKTNISEGHVDSAVALKDVDFLEKKSKLLLDSLCVKALFSQI